MRKCWNHDSKCLLMISYNSLNIILYYSDLETSKDEFIIAILHARINTHAISCSAHDEIWPQFTFHQHNCIWPPILKKNIHTIWYIKRSKLPYAK